MRDGVKTPLNQHDYLNLGNRLGASFCEHYGVGKVKVTNRGLIVFPFFVSFIPCYVFPIQNVDVKYAYDVESSYHGPLEGNLVYSIFGC